MATRTTSKTVTFMKPFVLGDFDEVLPPGNYVVETDEDLIQGLSFPAYIRVLTIIRLPAKPNIPRFSRALTIDPHELDAALSRDRESPEVLAWDGEGRADHPLLDDGHWPSADRLAIDEAENEGMMVHAHEPN